MGSRRRYGHNQSIVVLIFVADRSSPWLKLTFAFGCSCRRARSATPQSKTLHIGNLTRNVNSAHLEEIFGEHRTVSNPRSRLFSMFLHVHIVFWNACSTSIVRMAPDAGDVVNPKLFLPRTHQ